MKKIVIASDSYKESLSSLEVASCIETGFKKVFPDLDVVKIPISDGGEGTVDIVLENENIKKINVDVYDPLMRKINTYYAYDPQTNTAIIEMAKASGLELLDENEKNPLKTTTYGTGQIFVDAINKGIKNFIIGIGGSATNDAGIGFANALGYKFLDINGNELDPVGESLSKIKTIVESKVYSLEGISIEVACDVQNQLYGPNGAAYIYGEQKGGSKEQIKQLDQGLQNISKVFSEKSGKDYNVPGAGAAGGLGAGLQYFGNATLKSGIDIITNFMNLSNELKGADLLITGEGRIDGQSKNGKTPVGCAKVARALNIPTIAICGTIGKKANEVYEYNIDSFFSAIQEPLSLEEAMNKTRFNLENISENIARTLKIGSNINK